MQITTITLFLLAAMRAVSTPIERERAGLDARAEADTLIKYTEGKCTRAKNECRYTGQNGKVNYVKCPSYLR
ncbi:hypothetical protein BO71DRAFT_328688 [Aspergillus ellipticus CBS 707.79]|uniref:Antifungal protein n=1 Tax=Aspergillus ellipticus CBS 707.79 TaxID=1448320 RepID=A0A319D6S1_9EURO|nr:hypothetical protein BO71DRAFT_328688 [Aspergillus ellipticus CBS 707.79]